MKQSHLSYNKMINLGSYYTNEDYVDIVWDLIKPFLKNEDVVIDTSCGYGNFFKDNIQNRQIGIDIDKEAIKIAKKNKKNVEFFNKNSLYNIDKNEFNIKNKLFIIGNPPYNDTTSIIRSNIKDIKHKMDLEVKSRDLGVSFLKSYSILKADYVAVLHPLSYLIKKTNFNSLKEFKDNYKLIEGIIISSNTFSEMSKNTPFPILISLYQRDNKGMDYSYIENFKFKIYGENKEFSLSDFDYIDNYIEKYPNNRPLTNQSILFHTLRDINALKRNRTFTTKFNTNSIILDLKKIDYYMYIDVFKRKIKHLPYYLGNCPIIIDDNLFHKYRDYFIIDSIENNSFLKKRLPIKDKYKKYNKDEIKENIDKYFREVLNKHYEN